MAKKSASAAFGGGVHHWRRTIKLQTIKLEITDTKYNSIRKYEDNLIIKTIKIIIIIKII